MIQIQKLPEAPQIWTVCWAIESLPKVLHPDLEDMAYMAYMAYMSRSYSLPFTWFFRSCILLNTLTDAPPPTTLSHIPPICFTNSHGMSHHFEVCTVSENNGLMASSTSDIRGESPCQPWSPYQKREEISTHFIHAFSPFSADRKCTWLHGKHRNIQNQAIQSFIWGDEHIVWVIKSIAFLMFQGWNPSFQVDLGGVMVSLKATPPSSPSETCKTDLSGQMMRSTQDWWRCQTCPSSEQKKLTHPSVQLDCH